MRDRGGESGDGIFGLPRRTRPGCLLSLPHSDRIAAQRKASSIHPSMASDHPWIILVYRSTSTTLYQRCRHSSPSIVPTHSLQPIQQPAIRPLVRPTQQHTTTHNSTDEPTPTTLVTRCSTPCRSFRFKVRPFAGGGGASQSISEPGKVENLGRESPAKSSTQREA